MPAASLGDLLDFRGKDCYDNIHNKILFFVKCPLCLCVSAEKRESGGSPERSGHCEQGALSHMPLCKLHEKACQCGDL